MNTPTDPMLDWLPIAGFGGVAGVAAGYAAKKITRLVVVLVGLLFITAQALAYYGFITIDWGAVQGAAETAWRSPDGMTVVDRAWSIFATNLPFVGAFTAGFVLGLRLG